MDMIERYLQAVRWWLPREQRQDIIEELREDIRSEVEERSAMLGRPLDEAETEELLRRRGRPVSVASRYLPQRHLIGPALFPLYLTVLKGILFCYLIPWLAVWVGLVVFSPAYRARHPGWALLETLSTWWSLAFGLFGLVTAFFAAWEWRQGEQPFAGRWNPRRLPPVRDASRIPRINSAFDLVFSLLAAAWWVELLRFLPGEVLVNGHPVPLSLGPVWKSFYQTFYWPILTVLLGGTALAVTNLVRPYWTRSRIGGRALLHAVPAAMLLQSLVAQQDAIAAAVRRLTHAPRSLPTAELLGNVTDVMIVISLLIAALICLGIAIRETTRLWRWPGKETRSRS